MVRQLPGWILAGSILLAINAGLINSIALLSFANNAVSHVTGTVTLVANAMAEGNLEALIYTGSIVLSFLAGAILSGFIVGDEALSLGRHYGVALGIEGLLLLLAWYGFTQEQLYAEWLASAACGLQNALVATYSGSVIRTTHLTGIVSDIGSSIGNFLARRGISRIQLVLQCSIVAGFVAGAGLGAVLFDALRYHAVLVNTLLVFGVATAYILYIRMKPGV